jgi:hypothetical protein
MFVLRARAAEARRASFSGANPVLRVRMAFLRASK